MGKIRVMMRLLGENPSVFKVYRMKGFTVIPVCNGCIWVGRTGRPLKMLVPSEGLTGRLRYQTKLGLRELKEALRTNYTVIDPRERRKP
jgi:exosome complex RNA-binding protein Rrp4